MSLRNRHEAKTSTSGRERQVVLDAVAAAALGTYIKDWRKPATGDRHVFTSNRDRPFTRESFCNVFDALRVAMHQAGVDGFMCHRLRHTWATNAHRVGLSFFDIQEQGGGKKVDIVRRYAKSRPISELRRMPTSLAACSNGELPNHKVMHPRSSAP